VVKATRLRAKVFIVGLDLLAIWVPRRPEVEACERGSSVIEVLHDVF